MDTVMGYITIKGSELEIVKLDTFQGNVTIKGKFDSLVYSDIGGKKKDDECTIVLRPEAATLADDGQLPCDVILSCFMGSYQNYHVMVGDTLVKITDFNPKNKKTYQVGDKAFVKFDIDSVHVI